MRRFRLLVDRPAVGSRSVILGRGHVADGVRFADGVVVVRWRETPPSTTMWDGVDQMMATMADIRVSLEWVDAESETS